MLKEAAQISSTNPTLFLPAQHNQIKPRLHDNKAMCHEVADIIQALTIATKQRKKTAERRLSVCFCVIRFFPLMFW